VRAGGAERERRIESVARGNESAMTLLPSPSAPLPPSTTAPDELLRHLPFVRGLARELLADEAAADDVAQEALLAALRRPQLRDGWRPWLVGTTRNLALLFRRGEARRAVRERATAIAEALPSSSDESARLESLRRVVDALERLAPADRSLLLRRWYDNWPPRRIAAELGIPVDTARTRLQRALEKLRRELALRDSRERMRLLAPLLVSGAPLAATKAKVAIASAAALLFAVAAPCARWWTQRDATEARHAPIRAASVEPARDASLPAELVARRTEADSLDRAAPPESGLLEPVRVALRGRLLGDPARLESWSTTLRVVGAIQQLERGMIAVPPAPDRFRHEIAVARDGSFAADFELDRAQPPLCRLALRGDDPRFAPFERRLALPDQPEPGSTLTWTLEIPLFAAATVRGRVVDAAGATLPSMAVAAFVPTRDSGAVCVAQATSDVEGSFALAIARGARCTVVATQPRAGAEHGFVDRRTTARPELRAALAELDVAAGEEHDVGDLVMREGVAIRGRVELYARGPAAGAVVVARRPGNSTVLISATTRAVDAASGVFLSPACFADERGDFALEGLAPGPWEVAVAELPEGCFVPGTYDRLKRLVEAPADGVALEVELALVEFRCTTRGAPIEGVRVRAGASNGATVAWRRGSLGTDALGATGIAAAPRLELSWYLDASGFEEKRGKLVMPAAGELAIVPIELVERPTRPALRLRIRGPRGETIARNSARLYHLADDAPNYEQEFLADRDGWCVVHDVVPGRYRLTVRPGGGFSGGDGCFATIEETIEIAADRVVEVELTAEPAARLRVQARSADGALLPARLRLFDDAGHEVETSPVSIDEDERGAIYSWSYHDGQLSTTHPTSIDPALPPGRYEAYFTCAGFAERRVPLLLEAGRCTELDVVLQPAR